MLKRKNFKELVFKQNLNNHDIYDIVGNNFKDFTYIRLSKPRDPKYNKQGASYIIESWQNKVKVLFTGLIPVMGDFYYGDHINIHTGKKSTLIVKIELNKIIIFYFNASLLYPRAKLAFVKKLINEYHYV